MEHGSFPLNVLEQLLKDAPQFLVNGIAGLTRGILDYAKSILPDQTFIPPGNNDNWPK